MTEFRLIQNVRGENHWYVRLTKGEMNDGKQLSFIQNLTRG